MSVSALFLDALDTLLAPEDRSTLKELVASNEAHQTIITSAVFWVDGKRDLQTICSLVRLELGYTDEKLIESYFRLLKKTGMMRW